MITRFAPTPSGYLHIGNCVNALLVDWLARAHGGALILRIDDVDADRYRPEYVDDMFRVLRWLDIQWHAGPRDTAEFEACFSMRDRTQYYRDVLHGWISQLDTYACECSRSDLRAARSLTCVRGCRSRELTLTPGESALRLHVPIGTTTDLSGRSIDLAAEMGDFVLWRRDDRPSYQLASLIEDRDLEVTHVVRGSDLLPSTAAQLHIACAVSVASFRDAVFVHHPLIADAAGNKLSKSQLDTGPLTTSDALADEIVRVATELAAKAGITPAVARR